MTLTFYPYTDCIHVRLPDGRRIGDLYKEIDGFYVFAFDDNFHLTGFFPESFFLQIGNKLKELNAEWDALVTKELSAKNEFND